MLSESKAREFLDFPTLQNAILLGYEGSEMSVDTLNLD